ncbi:hypothetical protein RFI_04415 [Reticulomyxa filosa]|uniref:Uncharacterized protein n=1 Tax=Reticulomyxa filosa TaxID=46433 RepID=X6P2B2_RETFI|nr:hypothetical protein RFI_04415 [Reticulomyxa filosa]|eukprot:ETO32695.1 hypothetical protein RFI_04415 [Reticulomyxa filosa]
MNLNQYKSKLIFTIKDIRIILQHWIKISHVKFGWINEFNKLISNYLYIYFTFHKFISSHKLTIIFNGHINTVFSIDYVNQFIYSGSSDKIVRVWDINNKQIKLFDGHSDALYCVKFSSYIIKTIIKMSFVLHQIFVKHKNDKNNKEYLDVMNICKWILKQRIMYPMKRIKYAIDYVKDKLIDKDGEIKSIDEKSYEKLLEKDATILLERIKKKH